MTFARPDRWLWALPALVTLWGVALWRDLPEFEAALRGRIFSEGGVATSEPFSRSGARIEVDGRDVSVVTDVGLSSETEARARAVLAAIAGVRRVAVATPDPVALDPFVFTVRRRGDTLQLTGGVPSPRLHAALIDAARTFLPPGRIDDRLRLATGASAGFDEAAAQLVRLSSFLSTGELTITGPVYSAVGDARDFAAYNAARDALAAPLRGFDPADLAVRPPVASPFAWSATREGDVATLSGHVPTESARAAALAAARAAFPRGTVLDRMQTARGLDAAVPFETVAAAAMGTLGRLQSGTATLSGRAVSLDGASPARDLLDEVREDLRRGLPSGVTLERIALRAVPADPFRLGAVRANGRLTFDGYVPSAAARGSLLATAARRFPADAIVDGLHLADGAPPDFAAAADTALAGLSELADGAVALTGRDVRLSGTILYPEMAGRLASRWPTTLPTGWSGGTLLDVAAPAGSLDPLQCGDLLSDAAARQPIRFEPGKAEIGPATRAGIEAAIEILRRCGPGRLALAGGTGQDADLVRSRRDAVEAALKAAGLPPGLAFLPAPVDAIGPADGFDLRVTR